MNCVDDLIITTADEELDGDEEELKKLNNNFNRDYGTSVDNHQTTTSNNSGYIVKNKYFFNENTNEEDDDDDKIEIINEKLYKEHFNLTTTQNKINNNLLPIFTSANKSNLYSTVDSNNSTICSGGGGGGRSFGPTNKLYEATKQNKFNSEQNNKLYDEVYEVNEDNKLRSLSSSSSSTTNSSSLDDDGGYCITKPAAAATDYVTIQIEDNGINNYNKNFKKQSNQIDTVTSSSPSSSSSLLNQKYKFDKKIESTAAAAAQQKQHNFSNSYSFNYVDDDDVIDDDKSNKNIDKEINSNTRVSQSTNLKSDFINPSNDHSNELLSDLTSKFLKKFNTTTTSMGVTAIPSSFVNSIGGGGSKSNLQSNFYNLGKTEVDKQIVYGLKSSTSSLPATTMTTTSTTSAKGYNKFNNTSSLFTSSTELYKSKPQSNFDIDSHGSTGTTNSSNHDDSSDRSEEFYENSKATNNVIFYLF